MTRLSEQTESDEVELSIALEKVCFIIVKAREFDAKDVSTLPEDASNPTDDRDASVLEDRPNDASQQELRSMIRNSTVDEQIDLVALNWVGRDEFPDSWNEVRAQAAAEHNDRTADYLIGDPLLADHLADGLSAIGLSCADYEAEHL
ncbi:DUF3775 domain-containing protein [Pseudaminobacter sp. 19-2017]|uniref:DUF3775 domain-containing protein n=1 Tax=Pseudaminobacter soli (ex Zhang et al. 2022) TaxID=2831468 RepID=A0A942E8S6_9HYPH|nr:DUF3775 domain-containing protein [Pseudaminobacter soli]MBS3650517.1 DUF3775 domain-containing protein [Pseudaminobacter soli]